MDARRTPKQILYAHPKEALKESDRLVCVAWNQIGGKPRNTMADFDTISASFDGSVVGRGTYVLEHHYTNGAADPWWRGRHTFYDCHHNVMLTCPIVLGPPALRKQMEADQWLDTTCWVETSPTRTTMQRTASK